MKIIITGTTGVGKSTTVDLLEEKLKAKNRPVVRIGELVVNSEFFDFYFENLSSWGFLSQISFLLDRFKQWLEVERKINTYVKGAVNIFDRHFLDDLIFSELYWIKQNLSQFESSLYKVVYEELLNKLRSSEKIDYLFLLKADFEVVKDRMINRGRTNEINFNTKYWVDLYNKYYNEDVYQNHFKSFSKHMITIDTSTKSPDQVAEEILSHLNK